MVIIVLWNAVLPKFDPEGLRYMFTNAGKSYFIKSSNEEVEALKAKTGGFIEGVCHPNENYEQIAEANIEWVRFDLTSMPYDEDGNPTEGYLSYKERAKSYADKGFKVMCITPYPKKYIEAGYDPREEQGQEKIKEYARFIAQDLQGIVSAFQITNEMGIEHFTLPLTIEEAAEFIGIQLEAMWDVKGDIIAGFNCGGTALYNLCTAIKPYLQYADYVGMDIYLGCFEDIFKELYVNDLILRALWSYTGKPIMMCEFGYMGYGDVKTEEQKNEILKSYGFENEEAARADFMTFVNNLPEKFRDHLLGLEYSSEEELADKLFNTELASHLYKEIPGGYQLNDYRHTPEDQARFFTDAIAGLKKLDFLCGAFVYCYSDSDACYICGQEDCPVETGWGLVDLNGDPKPAYYAVQEAFKD
ncbi:MAG: hypothetical protein ACI4W6_08985 [Acutalibacteraceae bacterium]